LLIERISDLKTLIKSLSHRFWLFTIILFNLAAIKNCFSQQGQILNFEKLTINDGLSQGFVYNIAQDDRGFMWFCTPDGLNRYDGYHFKIYRHDDADSFSVSSNLVTKFFIDTQKNTWIATNDNGLNYFDIPHQRFYHFFRGLAINDIVEDKYQNLIAASGSKIILCKIKQIEGVQFKKISFDTATFLFQDAIINRNDYIHYHLFTDSHKNVYLTSRDAIFKLMYDEKTNRLTAVKLYSFSEVEAIEPEVAEDRATHKFYACLHGHLLEFPDSNFRQPAIIAPLPYARAFLIDGKQRLWYGASLVSSVVTLRTRSVIGILPNLWKPAICSMLYTRALKTGVVISGWALQVWVF
jgi:hypothetical protein